MPTDVLDIIIKSLDLTDIVELAQTNSKIKRAIASILLTSPSFEHLPPLSELIERVSLERSRPQAVKIHDLSMNPSSSFHLEGFALSPCDQNIIDLIDLSKGQKIATLALPKARDSRIEKTYFLKTSNQAVICYKSGEILLWDISENRLSRRLEGHHSEIVSSAFLSDRLLLATVSIDGILKIWDLQEGTCSQNILTAVQNFEMASLEICDISSQILFSYEQERKAKMKLWNFETGEHLATIIPMSFFDSRPLLNIFYSKGTKILSGCIERDEVLFSTWDMATSSFEEIFFCISLEDFSSLTINKSGSIYFQGCKDGLIFIHKLVSNQLISTLRSNDGAPIEKLIVSPDESLLFSITKNKLCAWDLSSYQCIKEICTSIHDAHLIPSLNAIVVQSAEDPSQFSLWDLQPLKSLRVSSIAHKLLRTQEDAEEDFKRLPSHIHDFVNPLKRVDMPSVVKRQALHHFIAKEYLPEMITLEKQALALSAYPKIQANVQSSFYRRFYSLPNELQLLVYRNIFNAHLAQAKISKDAFASADDITTYGKEALAQVYGRSATYEELIEALEQVTASQKE